MKTLHVVLALVLICLCAAVWVWLHFNISFTADQMFLGDRPLQNGWVALAVAGMYFLGLPVAVIALFVLLLLQLRQ
ncbi:MAG TPA: hypothetical protein VHK01_11550 [Lacipirellulaceae bacterium]|jgi:hypothetical protein|nr:hypothetical protein [Lacipirellulaceae bacterium]